MRVCAIGRWLVLLLLSFSPQIYGKRARSLLSSRTSSLSADSQTRILRKSSTLRILAVGEESSSDAASRHLAFTTLPDITVWKALFPNNGMAADGSGWSPGYMLLKKTPDWEIPSEFGVAMEECFLEGTRERIDMNRIVEATPSMRTSNRTGSHNHKINQGGRHLQEETTLALRSEGLPEGQNEMIRSAIGNSELEGIPAEESDMRLVNATLCPTLDVSLQVVNSIVTRVVFLPDGNIVPFDVVATDYVGSLENMEKESQILDVLTLLESMDIVPGGGNNSEAVDKQPDRLVLRGPLGFAELENIPDCTSVSCYAHHIFSSSSSFWSLDSVVGDDGEWMSNGMLGAGVWIQFENIVGDDATMVIIPDVIGGDTDDGVSVTFSIASGKVKDRKKIEDGDDTPQDLMDMLQDVSERLESLSFDLTDIPFMLDLKELRPTSSNITSSTRQGLSQGRSASLYLSYFGDML